MHDDDRDCERTSVARTREGTIRLRTPEGQEIHLTPERALEWTDDKFQEQLRHAAINAPIMFRLPGG